MKEIKRKGTKQKRRKPIKNNAVTDKAKPSIEGALVEMEKETELMRGSRNGKDKLTVDDVKGITEKGLRLLVALQDYEPTSESITDLCAKAGISRVWYYELMSRPGFQAIIRRGGINQITSGIPALIKSLTNTAIEGDPRMMRMALIITGLLPEGREKIDKNKDSDIPESDDLPSIDKQIKEIRAKDLKDEKAK